MLLGWSHVHTSPVNVCAPAVGAGAGAVAQPAKTRPIAAVNRAFMAHLRVVETALRRSRPPANIQRRCQHDGVHISADRRAPTGDAVTELCELALTSRAGART